MMTEFTFLGKLEGGSFFIKCSSIYQDTKGFYFRHNQQEGMHSRAVPKINWLVTQKMSTF